MSASRAAVALVAATSAQWAVSAPVIPFPYPQLYKQCDLAWGNDLIGQELDVTICDVGCLMSSTSMALVHNNITIPSLSGNQNYSMTANPQSLNRQVHTSCCYMVDPLCTVDGLCIVHMQLLALVNMRFAIGLAA